MSTIIDGSAGITFPNGTNPQAAPSKVLQVISQTFQGTAFSTTSSSMVATGFGASITPLFSTSKILVRIVAECSGSGSGMGISIARGTTIIWNPSIGDGSGYYGAQYGSYNLVPIEYLDSPSTTSSVTYNLYVASRSSGNSTINGTNTNNGGTTITLMEIAQ